MVLESSNAQTGECILVWGTLGLSRARGSLGASPRKCTWLQEPMHLGKHADGHLAAVLLGGVDLCRSWDSALNGFPDICLLIQSWATVLSSNCPASYKMWGRVLGPVHILNSKCSFFLGRMVNEASNSMELPCSMTGACHTVVKWNHESPCLQGTVAKTTPIPGKPSPCMSSLFSLPPLDCCHSGISDKFD